MTAWSLLLEIVFLLAACLVLGGLAARLGQSPLVGYLLAGMVLGGPGSLHVVESQHDIEAIAELGVALLLFSLGLEFSWKRLRSLGGATLGAGGLQVVGTGAVAAVAGLLFDLRAVEAVAVGAMVSVSSTAAVLRVLVERGEVDAVHGRETVGVLLVQDAAVVPLAILVTLLAGGGSADEVAVDVLKTIGLAIGLVVGLYAFLNVVAVRVLATVSLLRNRELTVLLAVVVGLGSTWSAHAAGLSPALGAFVAGMLLGSSHFATQIRADVASLRAILLTLFFGAVGMVADPLWILANPVLVLGVTVLFVAGKAVLATLALTLAGKSRTVSIATGVCLAQVGEFAFVLGNAAAAGGVLGEGTQQAVVSGAIASLFLTPYLVALAPRIAARLHRGAAPPPDGHPPAHPEVIIVGFGPSGQAVGRALGPTRRRTLVIDLNATAPQTAVAMGLEGHIGDASQPEVLEHAGVREAAMVVLTLPGRTEAMAVLAAVRAMAPRARVLVRSRYRLHTAGFRASGAHEVVDEEAVVGEELARRVLAQLPPATGS